MSRNTDCMSGEGSDVLLDEQFLNNEIRKRRAWQTDIDSLASQDLDLLDIDDDLVEEDEAGCPLPSTPEDNQLLEEEVRISYLFVSLLLFDKVTYKMFVFANCR